MPRSCTVCGHEERAAIDEDLVEGKLSNRAVGAKWGVSKDALRRHRKTHIPAKLAKAAEAAEVAEASDLLSKLSDLEQEAAQIGAEARGARQFGAAMRSVDSRVDMAQFLARLRGETDNEPARVEIEWVERSGDESSTADSQASENSTT